MYSNISIVEGTKVSFAWNTACTTGQKKEKLLLFRLTANVTALSWDEVDTNELIKFYYEENH